MDRGAWWTRVNWGHRRATHNLETKTTTISNGLISIHPKHKIIREIFSLRFFCAVFNLMRISKLQPFSIWNHTQVSNIHALTVQNPPASRRCRRCEFDPWVWKLPRRKAWQPTIAFLPRKSHGQGSLGLRSMYSKSWTQLKQLSMYTCTEEKSRKNIFRLTQLYLPCYSSPPSAPSFIEPIFA